METLRSASVPGISMWLWGSIFSIWEAAIGILSSQNVVDSAPESAPYFSVGTRLVHVHKADIHQMTGFLSRNCSRTVVIARVSPYPECQHAPAAGNIGAPLVGAPRLPSSRRTSPLVLAGTDGDRTRVTLAPERVAVIR